MRGHSAPGTRGECAGPSGICLHRSPLTALPSRRSPQSTSQNPLNGSSLTDFPSCVSLPQSPFVFLPSQEPFLQNPLTGLPSPVPPHGAPPHRRPVTGVPSLGQPLRSLPSPELLQESPVIDLHSCVSLTRVPSGFPLPESLSPEPPHRSPFTTFISRGSLHGAPGITGIYQGVFPSLR